MGKPLQAKLLRFLEDGTFTRVGGTEELRVDVRLIAATNRDIVKAIAAGDFREDLFHRLNVVQFNLPPCANGAMISLCWRTFLEGRSGPLGQKYHRFHPGRTAKTANPPLAGQRAGIAQCGGTRLDSGNQSRNPARQPAGLCRGIAAAKERPIAVAPDESLDSALERLERELIQNMLEQNNFNLTRAAEALKLSRHSLRYRMQRLNMKAAADGGETVVNHEKVGFAFRRESAFEWLGLTLFLLLLCIGMGRLFVWVKTGGGPNANGNTITVATPFQPVRHANPRLPPKREPNPPPAS